MPSVTVARTRASALPADERRSTIVDAAIPLLIAHGEAVTSRQIAEAAGIAEGTIFRVFDDKRAVIDAAIEAVLDPGPVREALAAIDRILPLEDRLVLATMILQERVVTASRLLVALGPRFHEARHHPPHDTAALVDLLRPDAKRLRIPIDTAASHLRGLTLSLSHPLLTAEPMTAEGIVDLFLHGAVS